jgi:hypothetical protein
MRRVSLGAAILLSLAACGDAAPPVSEPEPRKSPTVLRGSEPLEPGGLKAPPPVTVTSLGRSIELHAWTYCYKNGCADGAPPPDPPAIGSADEVIIQFPLKQWSFKASFSKADEKCARVQTVPLTAIGDGQFVLRPAGFADTYDVTLMGRGNGDLFTTFTWTTPVDGPLPEPSGRLAVLSDHDGAVDSYGVELELRNLERTPRRATARITIEARDGEPLTFMAKRARGQCFPEGTVYWDGPDNKGTQAAALGDAPFTYEVEITLDGERYVAHATWPDDEIRGNEPSVTLEFTPALPGLR